MRGCTARDNKLYVVMAVLGRGDEASSPITSDCFYSMQKLLHGKQIVLGVNDPVDEEAQMASAQVWQRSMPAAAVPAWTGLRIYA